MTSKIKYKKAHPSQSSPQRQRLALLLFPLFIALFTSSHSIEDPAPSYASDSPFEYYVRPFTMLSHFGHPEETQVTPEGALRTHCGTFSFFVGPELHPLHRPLITLQDGELPIVTYSTREGPIRYTWTAFATTIPRLKRVYYKASLLNLTDYFKVVRIDNLVNLIQVRIENLGTTPALYAIGMEYDLGSGIPMQVDYLSKEFIYFDWKGREFRLADDGLSFGDKREVLCAFSQPLQAAEQRLTLRATLQPGASENLLILLPYFPSAPRDLAKLHRISFENERQRKSETWRALRSQCIEIYLPEQKPLDTFYASLMYLYEGHVDYVGKRYILRGNPFQYDQFYIRDGTFVIRAFDLVGLHDLAQKCLSYFLQSQDSKGRFASQKTQYDANGMALWAIGQHYELTRNAQWARKAFSRVRKSMRWLYDYRETLPDGQKGLMQPNSMNDNEQLADAHLVGHNLWALAGMKKAVLIAEAAGQSDVARMWNKQYQEYQRFIDAALQTVADATTGCIPPAFEGPRAPALVKGRYDMRYGFDWGNLALFYPCKVLNPHDPRVTTSLAYWRQFFREGLFPYPEQGNENFLHHYLTFDITETSLVRGEQELVVNDLYEGYLLHTTAAHAGCERLNIATRDFWPASNITPHGTFAAKYIALIRNCLVREDANQLHLLSFLAPAWCRPGSQIRCLRAPTTLGQVSFIFDIEQGKGHLQIRPPRRSSLSAFVVHLPPFWNLKAVQCDGKPVPVKSPHTVTLPPDAHAVDLQWDELPHDIPSYQTTIQQFLNSHQLQIQQTDTVTTSSLSTVYRLLPTAQTSPAGVEK